MKEVDKRVSRKLKDREREQASLIKKRKPATQQTQVLKYKCSRLCIIPANASGLVLPYHLLRYNMVFLPFLHGPKHLRLVVAT